ncbi:hypothetical protein [Streptomyces sp. NBC_00690]|uniref:hypothetical protein n=1 Tax=Streptomyces sp. NBC_00690 TaxID=2975808 RepID=UPI002E2AD600|nr:hypothetical protein [Streptomyces sp. NBC_00690]
MSGRLEVRDSGTAVDVRWSVFGVRRSAFGGGHPAAVLYRVVQETPDLSLVDHELRGLVAACLAKAPGDRPSLAEILETFTGEDGGEDWLPQPITTMIGEVEIEDPGLGGVAPAEGGIGDIETPGTRKQRRGLSRFFPNPGGLLPRREGP